MRFKKVRNAKKKFNEIYNKKEYCVCIHYSCEGFLENIDKSARISSIAVKFLQTGQTESFSIGKMAELNKISSDIENNYDFLEKEMLFNFFKFAREHKDFKWIHWNMRDIKFGFQALENRLKILDGKDKNIYIIKDSNKYDLSRLLIDYYSEKYISHPRLLNIIKKNKMSTMDFLEGEDEAKAFKDKNYIKLHCSTLRKVDIFSSIIDRVNENTFKTNANIFNRYGVSFQSIFEAKKDNWFFAVIFFIIITIIGIIIKELIIK